MTTLNHQTDEALDRMLAELVGLCVHAEIEKEVCQDDWNFVCKKCGADPHRGGKLPRYTQSLDACHKVEQEQIIAPFEDERNDSLAGGEENYRRLLRYEAALDSQRLAMGMCKIWHATARQRTIALIRTLSPKPTTP